MLLLQPTLHHQQVSFTSSLTSYFHSLQWKNPHVTPAQTVNHQKLTVTCCISKIHNYGTVDYERRPPIRWNQIYRRISLMDNPELGAGSILDELEKERKQLAKRDLCRVVKELRKFKRHRQALEVYEWMSGRGRYKLVGSDVAIQLDLIAKVRGVSSAEEIFRSLSSYRLKDKRVYGAMLNAYARERMRDKAEDLLSEMKSKGFEVLALTYNVMMTLYMNLKMFDKVHSLVSEMMENGTPLDLYTYNIWISCCGSEGSVEKMEQVFDQMRSDKSVIPNWSTFSTLATFYCKMGLFEKAEYCLRKVESRITGRDRTPYHYLLSLYGNIGKKEEVHRIWNIYKAVFPTIPNLGYHAIISSLVRMDDIEGAEKLFEEWLSNKVSFDPRMGNLLMGWYVKAGNFDQAESIFDHLSELGQKPNAMTWDILAEGHIAERRISDALSCYEKAFAAAVSERWTPKPVNIASFFMLCEEEADVASKNVLVRLLRQSGCLKDKKFASLVGLSDADDELSAEENGITDENEEGNEENEGSEMLLSQF
ncbi:hypothetical protein Tsubulata_002737 [Turnera subulata]|uniref:Pentacotripeptide-repeat region of PRORP domain-containing protein n=1 Tax=Turnera subulata TaxID=218843 RepID=A0A9Q0GFH0_9ROSI|nr:hypothetical protein Tsubulata_002737 [Turnera subulata]